MHESKFSAKSTQVFVAISPKQRKKKVQNLKGREKVKAYDGSVLDAKVRQRVGGADVEGGERSSHDSEQESKIRPLVVVRH